MTAEIGVLNRIGVALAADSAVSIGRDADKIWTSADKLFHLSKSAPVGIMIFGNANYVGIPWETVIKEFRADLADKRYESLEEYAERFFAFLASSRDLFSSASQIANVGELVISLYLSLRDEIKQALSHEAEQRNGLSESEIAPIVQGIVAERLALIRKQPRLRGFGPKTAQDVASAYAPMVRELRREIFGELPCNRGTKRQLASVATEMMVRHYFGPSQAGVVIAGFGDAQPLPSIFAYTVQGMVRNRPRRALLKASHITPDCGAIILPFAQQESVHAFLRGVDDDLAGHMKKSTAVLFKGVVKIVVDAVRESDEQKGASLDAAIAPALQDMLDKLYTDWDGQSARFWHPIIQIVSSLPKDELAGMAEALVNLTKFRRRITPERETVGGPIDVAVITKGDGFVWIKRKHYFDSALNPRVIARYASEGSNGN